MMNPRPCFVEFVVDNDARFDALCRVFEAIKHDKAREAFRPEGEWLAFFDDQALAHFWWPTPEELEAHQARWWATPWQERQADPTLQPPSWLFGSLFFAFENGDYDLVSCARMGGPRARLAFAPHGFPFGGTDCMHMLIAAFGFRVVAEDNGTGYAPV